MRILLINPPIATEKVYSRYSFAAPTLPPLGLCYLASVLLKNEQEVKIVDCIAENITLSQLKNKIKKAGINVYGSFMIGIPTETKEDIEKTIEFATSLPLDGVSFFLYTPFPNTKLAEIAPKYGKINEKWESYAGHSKEVPYLPDGISQEYLFKIQKDAYNRFYFRIGYILRYLNRLFDLNFVKKSIGAIKIFMRDNKPKEGDI